MTKFCRSCQKYLPLESFYKRKDTDKYRPQCLECQSLWKKQNYKSKKSYYCQYFLEYREKNREIIRTRDKQYYQENIEDRKENKRKYYYENKEERILYIKAWQKNNSEKTTQYKKTWYRNNPDKVYVKSAFERCKRKNATPKWLTDSMKQDIFTIYKKAKATTKASRIKYEVDHIIPITGKEVCGLHVPWNLRIITKEENNRKSNKLLEKLI